MVSGKQARSSSKITSLGSKLNHGVTKQASNRYMNKRMNAHDSLLMKSFIRGAVRDEVERKFQELLISREKTNESGRSGSRSLELCFINNNKLPIKTFTKTNIIPTDEPLQVALFDVRSKSIVNEGPLSSIEIQICPIQGEFESCDDEDWTENEFKDNILHERDNKEPLLVGDRFITLKNGVASISKIMFTDNSGWVRRKQFRLGAKAMKNGENIKEGRSQPFRVKDIREESYKKHYPPKGPNQKNLVDIVKQDAYEIENLKVLQHMDISVANVNDGIQNVQINDDLHGYFDEAEYSTFVDLLNFDMDISNSKKPKALWRKIRAVVKLGISMRRDVAARRNGDLFYFYY